MIVNSKKLLKILNLHKIKFTITEHPPFYTVEDSKTFKKLKGAHTKNLFLKNKKKCFFLISCKDDTIIDLKKLKNNSIFGNLSFANELYLNQYLNLSPGSVTPFGLLFDTNNIVKFFLDCNLLRHKIVNFHPLTNTATIGLEISVFIDFMKSQNKLVNFINFDTYEIIDG